MALRLARAHALIVPLAPLAVVSALALGCNRADNAADRHAAEMRDSITRLQSDQDKLDQRLGVVEGVQTEDRQEKQAQKTPGPAAPPRVVQLGGPGEPDSEDPNAPDTRPEIRVVGQPGAYRPARGKSRNEDPPQLGTIGETTPRSSALDPDAKKTYEQGLSLVQSKQYAKGNEALAAFLVRWPDHPYAENATYWRGEAFFAQGEYLRAAEQFDAVLTRAGSGNKAPDALLKLGMCHDRLGSTQRAQEYWDRLHKDFPRSDAAKKIPASAGQKTDRSPKGPKESR
jgi:tol-pal system protein YbgF